MRTKLTMCCFCDRPWEGSDHAKCGASLQESFRREDEARAQAVRQAARRAKMDSKRAKMGKH